MNQVPRRLRITCRSVVVQEIREPAQEIETKIFETQGGVSIFQKCLNSKQLLDPMQKRRIKHLVIYA